MEQRLDRGTPDQRSGRTRGRCRHQRDDHPGATERLDYRISAGYFQSDRFRARRAGSGHRGPAARGRDGGRRAYPLDGAGPFGAAFAYRAPASPSSTCGWTRSYRTAASSRTPAGSLPPRVSRTPGWGLSTSSADRTWGTASSAIRRATSGSRSSPTSWTATRPTSLPHLLAPPPCPTPTTPASQCSCGSRARRSTPIGPPTFLGERNLLTSCAGISSTSPVPPTAPDRLELGAMQAVDLSGLTAFPPCCHPACRRRWPGGAAAARRDDPATVSPGRRGGRQRRPYRGRP